MIKRQQLLLIIFIMILSKHYSQIRYDATIVEIQFVNKKTPIEFKNSLKRLPIYSNIYSLDNKMNCSKLPFIHSTEQANYFIYGKKNCLENMKVHYSIEHLFLSKKQEYLLLIKDYDVFQYIKIEDDQIDAEHFLKSFLREEYIICINIIDNKYDMEVLEDDAVDKLNEVEFRFTVIEISKKGFKLVNRKEAVEIAKNHLLKMDVYKNLYIED